MHVLVIDDEERLARAVARGLADDGVSASVAFDGEQGYELATRSDFDAIVLDLMLPGLTGQEICRRLRSAGVVTPILVLTARDSDDDEADLLDLGADDYLRKPFSYVVLLARLNALLRRGPVAGPSELRVGDLVIDRNRRVARRGGRTVELTRRELALLEYLVRNAGRTLSKQEILDHVWGTDADRDANVVEVYMGYLRRKLDHPFGTRTLRTVRGEGYLLDAVP